jgi:putative tryptophan/tyrosine transport system substrate-binding protein
MRRRDFIQGIAVSSAWPLAARAQQPATMPVIGLLGSATASGWARQLSAFHQGLRDGGYVEGRKW